MILPRSSTGALLLVLSLSGCYLHREYQRNAPGDTDVSAPPRLKLEVPSDPGRHGVLLSGGLLAGGGREWRSDGPATVGQLQLELSAAYFSSPDGTTSEERTLPTLTGLNLGYTLLGSSLAHHALYAELQHSRSLLGVAGGVSWSPDSGALGPQATVFYGPLYVRLGWKNEVGGEALIGLAIKGYSKVSWFR